MKKTILLCSMFLAILFGCSNDHNQESTENSNDLQENVEAINTTKEYDEEISVQDSFINEVEAVNQEIEESAQKLDEIINDL